MGSKSTCLMEKAQRSEEDASGWKLAEGGFGVKTLSTQWSHSFHLAAAFPEGLGYARPQDRHRRYRHPPCLCGVYSPAEEMDKKESQRMNKTTGKVRSSMESMNRVDGRGPGRCRKWKTSGIREHWKRKR